MDINLNNKEYLKLLGDAANSKDGQIIISFLKNELEKLDYDKIDDKLPSDQKGFEFEAIRKAKKTLNKCLKILLSN